MRRKLPPMNALLAFESAARLGSFTLAARELSVAQPAITRHIANVENWLGSKVFTRRGSVIELTEEGRKFSELATAALDRLELGVREIRRPKSNEFVVGASFGLAHLWIMPRISKMRQSSGKNINLVTSDDYTTFDNSGIDFSIRFGNGDFDNNCADLLLEEKCRLIAAPSFLEKYPTMDPASPGETIDPKLMFDHGDPNAIGWMDWQTWHAQTGGKCPDKGSLTLVQSYPTMLDMICAGEGISIGTIGIEDELLSSGKIVAVGPTIARKGYGYYLVYRRNLAESRSFQKLKTYLIGS